MRGPDPASEELGLVFSALGLAPSAAQTSALLCYLELLLHWNKTYNLTAVRERGAMVTQHLADCLAVIPALRGQGSGKRVLDVGSGGGLPGAVIAIMRPDLDVSCVDAVGKKMAFVRHAAGALPLANLRACHSRVEALRAPPFHIITSRAFASLRQFVELTQQVLAPGGVWMAMKGRAPEAEIAELPPVVEVFHVEPLRVPGLEAERCLVWMRPRPAAAEPA